MDPFARIQKLQREPERRRRRLAVGIALVATALVALMWFLASFTSVTKRARTTPDTRDARTASPFTILRESIGAGVESFFESKQTLQKSLDEITTAIEEGGSAAGASTTR